MLGLFAFAAATVAQPAISRPSPYLFEGSSVVRVACSDKDGPHWGTAFYLGAGLYMTAAHVIFGAVCKIDGAPIKVKLLSEAPDYAIIQAAVFPPFHVNYSCDRLQPGHLYVAMGYAGTDRNAVAQSAVIATGVTDTDDKTAEVNGSLVQGMSGGPVADVPAGAVHGLNTWQEVHGAPYGGVTELADTILCSGGK